MRKEVEQRVVSAIAKKVFPGCIIGIVRANSKREVWPFGNFTYAPDSPTVREDMMYDMASVTKSIPVASLVLTFVAEGKIQLADTVVKYLPELKNDYGATVEDLLTYRVSGPRLSTLQDKTPDEILRTVFEHGFDGPPRAANYSNVPALLLGLILERVARDSLDALAQKHFFGPLGMNDTTFFPTDIAHVPPTEIVGNIEVRGIVHDESARVFSRAHIAVGHAGLFSTAPDILNFLEALLQGKLFAVLQGAQKGLGWQRAESWFMGSHTSLGAFGKTGFTGTSVSVDSERGIAFVILSNRTYPVRPSDAASIHSAMNTFRVDIADILLR